MRRRKGRVPIFPEVLLPASLLPDLCPREADSIESVVKDHWITFIELTFIPVLLWYNTV